MSKRAVRTALRLQPATSTVPAPSVPHCADLPSAANHAHALGRTTDSGAVWGKVCVLVVIFLAASTLAPASQAPETTARFSPLILSDPSLAVQPQTLPLDLLSPQDPLRGGWKAFVADHDDGWRVYLDGRSAAPLWVEGCGIPWIEGSGNSLKDGSPVTLESLEKSGAPGQGSGSRGP